MTEEDFRKQLSGVLEFLKGVSPEDRLSDINESLNISLNIVEVLETLVDRNPDISPLEKLELCRDLTQIRGRIGGIIQAYRRLTDHAYGESKGEDEK